MGGGPPKVVEERPRTGLRQVNPPPGFTWSHCTSRRDGEADSALPSPAHVLGGLAHLAGALAHLLDALLHVVGGLDQLLVGDTVAPGGLAADLRLAIIAVAKLARLGAHPLGAGLH